MTDESSDRPMPWFVPMPAPLWSAYLESPFEECVDCGCQLSESPVYIVQKRFVAGEAVFEMAICEACRAALVREYSAETRRNIEAFLNSERAPGRRSEPLPDRWERPDFPGRPGSAGRHAMP